MTKQDLINICEKNIYLITDALENPPIEYAFYNEFVKKYNYKTIAGLIKIPFIDFAVAISYPVFKGKGMHQVMDDITSFSGIVEDFNAYELHRMNDIILAFKRYGEIDVLKEIFNDNNKRRMVVKADNILEGYDTVGNTKPIFKWMLEKLIEISGQEGYDVLKLIEYYDEDPATASNFISMTSAFKNIREKENPDNYNSKEFETKYRVKSIMRIVNIITVSRKQTREKFTKIESNYKNKLSMYKRFLRDIENAFKNDEIRNYEMIIRNIDDEELKLGFLNLVYQHNKLKYDEIDAIHDQLTKNSLVNYITILKNYSIKKEDVDLNKVMRNSCEDVEKMLKILTTIVEEKDAIIRIIEISNLTNVLYMKELKSKNIVGSKTFARYPDIFDSNSDDRKQLDRNIETINNIEIDNTLFSKCPDVLIDNDRLDDNLKILKDYDLLDSLKTTKKYKFLKRENLSELIDKIIELEYEDLLVEDVGLLCEDNWDRIYVLKAMGIVFEDKKSVIECLRDNNFFVPDCKLKLYIEDTLEYYKGLDILSNIHDVRKIIKEKEHTPRSLNFDGVIISKRRLERNACADTFDLNDSFRGLFKGSILSMEEVETIKSSVKNKEYKIKS